MYREFSAKYSKNLNESLNMMGCFVCCEKYVVFLSSYVPAWLGERLSK